MSTPEMHRAVLYESFATQLVTHTEPLTFEGYRAMAMAAGKPAVGSYDTHQGPDLFRYFGSHGAGLVFPDSRPVHFVASHPIGASVTAYEADAYDHLPAQLHGVDLPLILNIFGGGILDTSADRILRATSRCTRVSLRGMDLLTEAHRQLLPFSGTQWVQGAARRSVPGELAHPQPISLGRGHTVAALALTAEVDAKLLLLDGTIAQTDRTQAYDIEAVVVPRRHVPDYLRLRYGALPTARVVGEMRRPLPA